ncbi:MAG: aminoglycoside 6'-acetyltransferase [Candidatus Hydrogenedentota bacterium]|nr:MAG: aminoglycoside 6'-acetyltransferase [Candidatus Hydrogenedentota bacterium]
MQVRPVTNEERDAWHRLRVALFPESSEEDHQREMDAIFADPSRYQCLIALLENKTVGFLEVGIREWAEGCATQNVGYLESIYVDEFFRRSGVGKALIHAAEQWSLDHGAQEIASDIGIDNEEGLRLHQITNYEEVGRSVLFRKNLI